MSAKPRDFKVQGESTGGHDRRICSIISIEIWTTTSAAIISYGVLIHMFFFYDSSSEPILINSNVFIYLGFFLNSKSLYSILSTIAEAEYQSDGSRVVVTI